jgi:hypothetical protein
MIALPLRRPTPAAPTPRRLVAGAVIASGGAIAFSVAVGTFVVGSSHRSAATAVAAAELIAATPSFIALGLAHLVVAAVLVAGTGRLRNVAITLTGVATIATLCAAATRLAGVDSFGGTQAGHPTTQGVGILLLASAAYAVATVAAAGRIRLRSAMIHGGGARWPSFPLMRPT